MKIGLIAICVVGLASVAAADKKPAKETTAQQATRSWLHVVIETADPMPVNTKKRLEYFVSVPTVEACAGLESGVAIAAWVLPKLKGCVTAAAKHFGKTPLDKLTVTQVKLDRFLVRFDAKQRPQMKAAAKGTTITRAVFDGDGESMDIYLAIGGDGLPRAIWADSNPVE